jgi:hypothetical protein
MVDTLRSDAFKDTDFVPVSKEDYEVFCKEYIFDKLRGDNFGTAFRKRFSCNDRVLSMFSDQQDVMTHIEYCGYIK